MNIGERIGDRYKVVRPIGSGGMANVYLAHDLILDRDVAIKVMRYDFRDDQDNIRRFKREALATTEMNHPNIVSIYDVGEEDTNPYIVMEYVEGMDLKEYIQNHYPIPYKKAVDIMEQILSGVGYAHEQGIIHRDLKPQNILVDKEGIIKISDFGIAVAISQNSITQTNSLLGSVHYLSPEQARGSMPSKQSDIYSLGIILYELLTGVVPFDGESAVSIALKHFQNPLPSLKEFDSRIPQSLENVVLKATAKDKQQRYHTVQEMSEDLNTVLSASRRNEPPYLFPTEDHTDTKVMTPLSYHEEKTEEDAKPVPSEKDSIKKETKKGKKRWGFIIGILLLLIVILGYFLATAPKDVEIPDLTKMTETEAIRVLEEYNLQMGDTLSETNEEIEEGSVTRTNPTAGRMVKENQTVDLYISTGRATIDFETYVGKSYEEARAQLTEIGFMVEKEEKYDKEVSAGDIIAQNISEGEEVVPAETTVIFTVSLGEAGIELEDLKEYSLKGVQTYIDRNDLNLFVKEDFSSEIPEGQVMSQSPEPGKKVYSNENITVVISKGPEGGAVSVFTKNVSVSYKAPEDEETEEDDTEKVPNTIEIYLSDSAHEIEDVYQEFSITENMDIEIPFILKKGETGAYRILRDGELVEEEKGLTE